jgi:4-amino-4-deoxy-L-arabinose transferase-like glycosyltransferase
MSHSRTAWDRLALVVIFTVGAWLRFQHIDDIEYNIDQVYPVWQALQTLDTGALPLAGQGTSVLFANPPLTGYLFVPALALVRQPIAAYALTLLLNTFAIWLAYRGLRWLIGTRPALLGAALFAVNPWIIEDSRRTWVQSLSPFFVCLVFWALAPVLTRQTRHPRRRVLIALVGLALFAHTYLLAYALIVPVGVLLLVYRRHIPKRALAAGGIVFAALALLYTAGLVDQWDRTTARVEEFASGDSRLTDEAASHAVRLVTGWGYADQRGMGAPQDDAGLRRDLSAVVHGGWLVVLVVGIGSAVNTLRQRQEATRRAVDAVLILLVWFGLPVLMMSYVSRVVHPFYLLLTVPAGHGLAALGLIPLLRRPRPLIVAAIVAAVAFTGAVNGVNTLRFAQNTAAHPGEDLPGTLPLGEAMALGDRLRGEAVIVSPMDEWTPATLAGAAIRVEQVPQASYARAVLVSPQGALYLVMQRDPANPVPPPLAGESAGPPLVLDDGTRIEFWRAQPDAITIAHPADVPSDIGVRFVGWTLHEALTPGATVTLDTAWRIDDLRPERGVWAFAPFAHVWDGDGARVVIADGEVLSALTWAAGDLMVQRMTFQVPDEAQGPFRVAVGLFDSVRRNDTGTPGINAIFALPDEHRATIPLVP